MADHHPIPRPRRTASAPPLQVRGARPRWVLHLQAVFWRVLMSLGMFFHRMAPPRPPKPDFSRTIPSTLSPGSGHGSITLNFYVPKDYGTQRQLWTGRELDDEEADVGGENGGVNSAQLRRFSTAFTDMGTNLRRRSTSVRRWGGYPVVINFHGGGFTLGSSGDDARWCGTVVNECHAVVISVDYRLAPEHPFPTAVEDGVDAVLYVHNHAEELGIDKTKIALSGFSSGGNMVFTIPLRLYDELHGCPRDEIPSETPKPKPKLERVVSGEAVTSSPTASSSDGSATKVSTLDSDSPLGKPAPQPKVRETKAPPDIKLACLIPWYPPVDYTRTRAQRRATSARTDQELPAIFTDLFDESYLHPPDTISLDSPYLSPGVAPTALLKAALPEQIIMHTCEWDMLLEEGEVFHKRLVSPEIGKKVWYKMIEGVPHGWDKAPNPWKPTPGVREHYLGACKEMRRVLWPSLQALRPAMERETTVEHWPTAAPRGSVSVVR